MYGGTMTMASRDTINSIDGELSSASNAKNVETSSHKDEHIIQSSSPDVQGNRQSRYGNKGEKERKIGHRRVGEGGEITYKKIQTSQIMGSIQLGIQHTVGSLASKPKRDLLMMDFWEIESITFPPEGSSLTPAHHYSEFRYKIYAPIAFRYFRDLFGIQPDDFMMSMCSSPLRELSNPGASGSIFYLTNDDEFIIKTVQHKEGEFLQKLLPGYYMNLNQNPRTLLPKFFGLYCLQTSNSKNIRLVVMNNLLPSYVQMHLKYDLKGSTFKRKASKSERSKKSPTYKDLDFMEQHPNGIFLEAETYNALVKTIQRDCTVLESFKIMDYSLLVGVHNLDLSSKEKKIERRKMSSKTPLAEADSDLDDEPETDNCVEDEGHEQETAAAGINRNRSVNRQRLVAHSTAMESIQAESEPIDDEDDIPPGGIPARSEKGERLLLFIGIIDILQSYRLKKKLEHTFKSIIHDGDTVSVCRPSFYAQRFQNFMAKTVFRKIPSPLKHSPSKRKSLSKAIQRSIENENETRSAHASNPHSAYKTHFQSISKQPAVSHSSEAGTVAESSTTMGVSSAPGASVAPPVKQRLSTSIGSSLKPKVPPPVPPRGSPRRKKSDGLHEPIRVLSTTPGTYTSTTNHTALTKKTAHLPVKSVSSPNNNSLKVQEIPRFGEQRSPSNVRDWLELHDLFEFQMDAPPQVPPPPVVNTNRSRSGSVALSESVHSVYSTARSEARTYTSNVAAYRPRLFSHVDIFQRQRSLMSRSDRRSSIGSIVHSFPPIRAETECNSPSSFRQSAAVHAQQPQPLSSRARHKDKRKPMLQYADMALSEYCDDQEDNLLQSMSAFLEVKKEFEGNQWSRAGRKPPRRPPPPVIADATDIYDRKNNEKGSPHTRQFERRKHRRERMETAHVRDCSTIPESLPASRCSLNPNSTTPSCSSTPPPAFDDISEDSSNRNSSSSIGRRSHYHQHQHHERKMNVGPAYRGSYKEDIVSVSEIHLDTYLAVDTSSSSQYGSRGGLAWTPPASGEGSTPTWTEGTPSFTDSSSSGDFENFSPINSSKIDRHKPTVEDALNSLSSEMIN